MPLPSASMDSATATQAPGAPLAPWTYGNQELFELEYEALFLRRWQFIGHPGLHRQVRENDEYVAENAKLAAHI